MTSKVFFGVERFVLPSVETMHMILLEDLGGIINIKHSFQD